MPGLSDRFVHELTGDWCELPGTWTAPVADGKGTHATQNRLGMYAAVEAALLAARGKPGPDVLASARDAFLDELRRQHHVVGHATDRHLELQARCLQFLLLWDVRNDGSPEAAVHAADAMELIIEEIRGIVEQPEHPAPRPWCRVPEVSAGRYMCGFYLPCPKHGPHE